MHAIAHSLSHRGPGASRARARWQPYSCTNLNSSTPSTLSYSPQQYLNTPNSSVLPPATTYISPAILQSAHSTSSTTPAKPAPAAGGPLREHKFKYVAGLVGELSNFLTCLFRSSYTCIPRFYPDQAVKSLCDIWQPEDIPIVFRAKVTSTADAPTNSSALFEEPIIHPTVRVVQLPSPISPTTRPSPISTSPISPTAQIAAASCRTSQVVPIRGFVHEVLRRSRTSTSVLQTALCYLEAVRSKVPDQIAREKAKADHPEDMQDQVVEDRIVMGDLNDEKILFAGLDEAMDQSSQVYYSQTVRVEQATVQEPLTAPPTELLTSVDLTAPANPAPSSPLPKQSSSSLPPLPALPSPLLCPRRTFLACLILASKFLQDRSYSNKAWAKLAGLPPREIGRCERALGEALEWRLWVGKLPSTSIATTPAVPHRAVARCRSEATLQLPTCNWHSSAAPTAPFASRLPAARLSPRSTLSGLRRSVTVPEIGSAARHTSVDSWMPPSITGAASFVYAEPEVDMSPSTQHTTQVGAQMDLTSSQPGSIFAFCSSPPLSTPSLTYSPMSTASTVSSDDGDRTAQFSSFVDIPQHAGLSSKFLGNITGPVTGYSYPPKQPYPHVQLAAFNPLVAHGPARLPSLSEAVSNPVLLEATITGAHVAGDNLAAYNTFGNWLVSN